MAQFEVPTSPTIHTATLSNFKGVDFTTVEPNEHRFSDMLNMVNNDGYLETRPGFDVIGHEFGTAATKTITFDTGAELRFTSIRKSADANNISIEFIKPPRRNNKLKLTQEDGKLKYTLAVTDNGTVLTTARDIADMENYYVTCITNGNYAVDTLAETNLSGGISKRINGVWNIDKDGSEYFIAHVENKLYRLDSNFANPFEITPASPLNNTISTGIYMNDYFLLFDGQRPVAYDMTNTNDWRVNYLDTIGVVPVISVDRNPDGTGGSSYYSPNLLTTKVANEFLADGTSTKYYVLNPDAGYALSDTMPQVTVIDPNTGLPQEMQVTAYNKNTGEVTLASAPPVFPVSGRSSVTIMYHLGPEHITNYINKCSIVTTYGYNSNNTRLFVTGNPDYPNIDWFSEQNDPLYFPSDNFSKVGIHPITNYLKLNDGTLAVQKNITDTDYTIYYRDSVIYNGKEAFTVKGGAKTVGCISKYANANLLNDPLTLTESGVFGISGSSYGEKFSNERSYFVKTKLLAEPNLENAIGIVYHEKYYLAVNNHVYVADGRYKTKVDEAKASTYQYEWYYWEDVPVRVWFIYNDELYFGTPSGDICKFNDTALNYNIPIEQHADTTFLLLGSMTQAKTVKRVTVISRPYVDNEYTLSYITNDDNQNIINKQTPHGDFPATLQEKDKIRKIMFVKFRLRNNTNKKMNFYRIGIEYVLAGKYRGD